jgi:hypothetical protein
VPEKPDRPKLQLDHSPVEIERKFLVAMMSGGSQWFAA